MAAEAVYLSLIAKYQSLYPAYTTNRGNLLFFVAAELRKSREELRAALGAGMNGPLAKPLEIPKLLEALQ